MLPNTDHPLNSAEFCAVYARAIFDVLQRDTPMLVFRKRPHALAMQKAAIELTLIEIGYFNDGTKWVFRQAGYECFVPYAWTNLPVEVFAQKVADCGVNMLNERCRRSDA